jgi:hypothetical protein
MKEGSKTPHPVALRDRPLPKVEGDEIFVGRPSHRNDCNGSGGMKRSKNLSLRENADPTRQASAPAVSSQKQMKQVLRCAQDDRVESALINNILIAMARKPLYCLM